ncbi:putative 40S ribosomal protein S7-1 isoform X2 [Capsicum annuum]|nr:putative 40S ribosomal protein S7-1 isoform X2 [Capsicum annuum]
MKQIPSNSTIDISRTWLDTDGCPSGTVPIKRVIKDDLIRQKHMPINISHAKTGGHRRAIVKTLDNGSNKFSGAGMVASLWNPSVEGAQTSACRLKIQKGKDSVQAGWRVDPTLYGDTKTRFFIHLQDAKGGWWLLVGERMEVGFWPRRIFSTLAKNFAENIEWGGSAYSPLGAPYAPMGSGYIPKTPDPMLNAYCRALTILNDKRRNNKCKKYTYIS